MPPGASNFATSTTDPLRLSRDGPRQLSVHGDRHRLYDDDSPFTATAKGTLTVVANGVNVYL